jgi:hypothetical protein
VEVGELGITDETTSMDLPCKTENNKLYSTGQIWPTFALIWAMHPAVIIHVDMQAPS